jgi:hypothetical protein
MNRRGSKGWPTPYFTSAQTTVCRVPGSCGSVPAALQELKRRHRVLFGLPLDRNALLAWEARHRAVRSSSGVRPRPKNAPGVRSQQFSP